MDIELHQAVLHIFDVAQNQPVYSRQPLPPTAEAMGYLKGLIKHSFGRDGRKVSRLPEASSFRQALASPEFIPMSIAVSERIFTCIQQNSKIVPADLLVLDADIDGSEYLCVLKCNHRTAYLHISSEGEGRTNDFIRQIDTLPPPNARTEECFFLNLQTDELFLYEKKVEIGDQKGYYLSATVLECPPTTTDKEKLKILQQASEEALRRHYPEVSGAAAAVDSMLNESRDPLPFEPDTVEDEDAVPSLKRGNTLSVAAVEERLSAAYPLMREDFMEALRDNGISASSTVQLSPTSAKRLEQTEIRTKDGIRITIPTALMDDPRVVEILPDEFGSLCITIKGIDL